MREACLNNGQGTANLEFDQNGMEFLEHDLQVKALMSFGVVDWFVGTRIPSLELYYSP